MQSKLQSFAKVFPNTDLFVVAENHGDVFGPCFVRSSTTGRDLKKYSRRRDARRALRDAGYTEEGVFWRMVVKAEQEPVFCAQLEKTP